MRLTAVITILVALALTALPAGATVTETSTTISYACDGSTVDFAFDFPLAEPQLTSDLVVILRTVATGDEDVLTETTEYTVSAVNNDYSAGGTVTTVATYSSAYRLTILRNTPKTQNATLVESDTQVLRLAALEDAYDKLTILCQDLQGQLDRCLKIPRSDTGITVEVDDSVSRVSTLLGFDSSGNATTTTTVPTGSIAVSSFMSTVLDDADAAAARVTLGIPTITAFAETVLDDADAATARTTLGAAGLTGNETVAGDKTFSGTITISNAATLGDSSQLASSAAPTADADIANKKYVDDGHSPYARMYITAAQDNLTDTTWATIALDTDEFDSGTITDTSNYKITPAVAGNYLVLGQITYSNVVADKFYQAQLYFNGASAKATASAHASNLTSDLTVQVCDVIVFDDDDYIQLRAYLDAGAATVDINVGTTDTFLVLYRL